MEPSPHTPTRSPNPQAAKAKESKGKYELPESWISQVSALEISSGFFVKGKETPQQAASSPSLWHSTDNKTLFCV
eukprot:1320281-Amorphochlora_amoeboformis.AAC.2